MPRIPSKANDSASSMWKMNDVYVARSGDEWPPTQTYPPNYADGYVARFTGYSSGDNDTQTNLSLIHI